MQIETCSECTVYKIHVLCPMAIYYTGYVDITHAYDLRTKLADDKNEGKNLPSVGARSPLKYPFLIRIISSKILTHIPWLSAANSMSSQGVYNSRKGK